MKKIFSTKILIAIFFFFFISAKVKCGIYYWVGGTGNWSQYNTHWATTSGGLIFHNQVPTPFDDVIFDSNSFSATGDTVFVDSTLITCKNMDWSTVTNNPVFISAGQGGAWVLKIYGSFLLSGNMVWNFFGNLRFESAVLGNNINTAAQNIVSMNFDGIGGGWTLLDSLNSYTISLYNGNFFTNNNLIRTDYFMFYPFAAYTIDFGSSTIIADQYDFMAPYLPLLDADSAVIYATNFSSGGNYVYNKIIGHSFNIDQGSYHCLLAPNGGTFSANNVVIDSVVCQGVASWDGNQPSLIHYGRFDDDVIFHNDMSWDTLVFNNPGKTVTLYDNTTQTINDLLSVNGNCNALISVISVNNGLQASISSSSATISASYLVLKDIAAAGGANFTANNSTALTNVTGWTVNAPAAMNLYWVGGTGNWNDPSHWSTSSGGAGGSCLPSPNDDVFFDSNSFGTNDTLYFTNSATAFCKNMNWTGVSNSPNVTGGSNIKIYGSFLLSTNMVWEFFGSLRFESTTAGNNINTAAQNIVSMNFDGIGGGWTLLDSLNSYTITLYNGNFFTNNNLIRTDYFMFYPFAAYTIDFGSSTIIADQYDFMAPYLPLLDADSAVIYATNFSSGGNYVYNKIIGHSFNIDQGSYHCLLAPNGGTFSANNVVIDSVVCQGGASWNTSGLLSLIHYARFDDDVIFHNDMTWDTLVFNNPGKTVTLYDNTTQTINDLLSVNGNCNALISVISVNNGLQASISSSSATISASYLVLKDIAAAGGANFTANNSTALTNVTGWTVNAPAAMNLYWVGGTGNWNDPSHWSTSSGGAGGSCLPSPSDDVFFDSNSFGTNDTLYFTNSATAFCKNMNWTGVSNSPNVTGGSNIKIYGSFLLSTNMVWEFFGSLRFESTTAGNNINTAAQNIVSMNFDGIGGGWTLLDSLNSYTITLYNGNFFTNNNLIRTDYFMFYPFAAYTIDFGSSTIIADQYDFMAPYLPLLDADSAVIYATNFSSGGNYVYNKIIGHSFNIDQGSYHCLLAPNGGTFSANNVVIDSVVCQGGASWNTSGLLSLIHYARFDDDVIFHNDMTWDTLVFNNPGKTVTLYDNTTQTINEELIFNSTAGFPISLLSVNNGSQATILKTTDTVCLDFMNIKDINVTGGAQFYAGLNSSDIANNTGWLWASCSLPFTNVWPGDANYDLITDNLDVVYIGLAYGNTGYTRSSASLAYTAQPCQDWSTVFTNLTNVKNADCDGNGIVNASDTTAVSLNYGINHPAKFGNFMTGNSSGPDLFLSPSQSTYSTGSIVSIPIELGTAANPAGNFYGLAFRINYDASQIVPGSLHITYTGSWLTPSGNLVHLEKDFYSSQYIDVGMARINHNNISGDGLIANLVFKISSSAAPGPINFSISNVTAMDNAENIILVNAVGNSIDVGEAEILSANSVNVFPNPFSEQTTVSFTLSKSEKVMVSIFTPEGVLVSQSACQEKPAGDHKISLNTKELSSGIYFCKVVIGGKQKVFKLVKN